MRTHTITIHAPGKSALTIDSVESFGEAQSVAHALHKHYPWTTILICRDCDGQLVEMLDPSCPPPEGPQPVRAAIPQPFELTRAVAFHPIVNDPVFVSVNESRSER